jgi:hypothetical protein
MELFALWGVPALEGVAYGGDIFRGAKIAAVCAMLFETREMHEYARNYGQGAAEVGL